MVKVWVDVTPVGVYVIHGGMTGLRVYEKEEAADEQGASIIIVTGSEASWYANMLSGNVIKELSWVTVGFKEVAVWGTKVRG